MKSLRGFSPIIILVIMGALIVLGGGYYYWETTHPIIDDSEDSFTNPIVTVTQVHSQSPATITVSYGNLPSRASALALCTAEGGGCTEWVEQFKPATSGSGTYTMSVKNAFGPESNKGIAADTYKIVVIGSDFSDQLAESSAFTVTQ